MLKNPNGITGFIDKSLSVAYNAVWDTVDYAKLLIDAASHNTYLETVKSEYLPDADTIHYHIESEEVNVAKLHETFHRVTDNNLKKLKNQWCILIFDYTYEAFYGYSVNAWINDYKPVRGSTGCFKFFSASLVVGNRKYFIESLPVNKLTNEIELMERVFKKLKELRIKVSVVLIDRGLANDSKVLRLLESKCLRYLGLYPKYDNVKEILLETNRTMFRIPFEVKGVKTNLVVIKTDEHDWTFVTNLDLRKVWRYVRVYKKRWNIETGFRVCDEARIKTKSLDIRVRYFLFLIAVLLYNLWYLLDRPTSFKRLVIRFWEYVEDKVDRIRGCKVP